MEPHAISESLEQSKVRNTSSHKAMFRKRQLPDPLAGSDKDGVAQGRRNDRYSRFSHSCRRSVAVDYVDVGLVGRFEDASHGVIEKVRLINDAVSGGYLAAPGNAGSKHGCAFKLC